MKHQLHFTFISLFLFTATFSSAQITFEKSWGGNPADEGHAVQQKSDGSYLVVGYRTYIWTSTELYFSSVNEFGDFISQFSYDATQHGDELNAVQLTPDGGFIIGGFISPSCNNCEVPYVSRYNSQSNIMWTNNDTASGGEEKILSLRMTADSGVIAVGYDQCGSTNCGNALLLKTDVDGNTQWEYTYGDTAVQQGNDAVPTDDGGFLLAGYDVHNGDRQVYLTKTDSDGILQWEKTFGGSGAEQVNAMERTSDGNFILVGFTSSSGFGGKDVFLMKSDINGDTLWTKTFGGAGDDAANSVEQTNDGGYIITGTSNSFGAGDEDMLLLKTDAVGILQWQHTFGTTTNNGGNYVRQTIDHGYVITGYATGQTGSPDIYLVKTDSNGFIHNCSLTPTIMPSVVTICQNGSDTLWTQSFSTYQWFRDHNPVPGATNQFYVATSADISSDVTVGVTQDTCFGESSAITINGFINNPPWVAWSGNIGTYSAALNANVLCEGDTLYLTLNSIYNTNIQWYDSGVAITGATNATYKIGQTGSYSVCGSPSICPAVTECLSDPVNVIVDQLSAVITQSNDTLFCSTNAMLYQWYLINFPVPGATNSYYVPSADGDYKVKATDQYNCTVTSPIYQFTNTNISVVSFSANDFIVTTLENEISITSKSATIDRVMLQDVSGKIILEAAHHSKSFSIPTTQLSAGVYLLEVFSEGNMNAFKVFVPKK